ncbi:30S ribosomal protein S12 methylthiotransferase RimO [Chlorobium sp. N1]|uniref:30S ribosomal protein S12 methylthiotransferase RimO n=1 Tax=Chlorobium sp. N1 TaxID=2491138 RepID=UPI00103C2E81|nr:30S ribosomal protein S12 methylthiotransferase RimO [Chlorobium sp. N1]TCD48576.1 30S ribosomal protein S12 methylthiotransferase RimO [Chlorobium sp. N1]
MDTGAKTTVFLLTLGCSKNTVDSERLQAQAEAAGVRFTEQAGEAEAILINTCGFIEDAKEESIAEILSAVELKEAGTVRKVYVMGCLTELYRNELQEELPEVDGFFGTRELPAVLEALGTRYRLELHDHRSISEPRHSSYLKIAEGCSRSCSFCSIPKIRGRYQSQSMDQLLREARLLQEKGVRELSLIAQDITLYGVDLYGRQMLNELLLRLSDMGFDWLRLLYAYPLGFPLEVIDTMRRRKNVCNYLDLPLQHASDPLLRSMNRGITGGESRRLIEEIRERNPEIRLRTTMIAGYPGESRREFEEMLRFVGDVGFDRLGCFPYRHEEHSPAYRLRDDVPDKEKEERVRELMELQEGIAEKKNAAFEGEELRILVDREEEGEEGLLLVGRTEYDAPEVDNDCLLDPAGLTALPGTFVKARISASDAYELHGTLTAAEG